MLFLTKHNDKWLVNKLLNLINNVHNNFPHFFLPTLTENTHLENIVIVIQIARNPYVSVPELWGCRATRTHSPCLCRDCAACGWQTSSSGPLWSGSRDPAGLGGGACRAAVGCHQGTWTENSSLKILQIWLCFFILSCMFLKWFNCLTTIDTNSWLNGL